MQPLKSFAGGLIADIVRRQPPSPARTAFAWQLVVGPALARATSVHIEGTTLHVAAQDERWLREISRAQATIVPRLQEVLGKQTITKISTR
jgi:predicted nucleic acid-binding Zn ribbon protein